MGEILVTGGAGYIGSHMVRQLIRDGLKPVIIDNLSNGFKEFVPNTGIPFYEANISDRETLKKIFSKHQIEAVINFAAFIEVGESVKNPLKFYANNVSNTLILLEEIIKAGVNKFIFSSTAALFGEPEYVPIDEKHILKPINPYGRSKLMVEQILGDFEASYNLQYGCLRYFNASGADSEGGIGESHNPETHLIPIVLQAALGKREKIMINGNDYDTPDGTCIRDYVHVTDLADAHLLLLKYMQKGGKERYFNLGTGQGSSIMEIIKMVEKVTNLNVPFEFAPRRVGDPSRLIADGSKARDILGWNPQHSSLENIIKTAYEWERTKT